MAASAGFTISITLAEAQPVWNGPAPIDGFEPGHTYYGVHVAVASKMGPGLEAAVSRVKAMGVGELGRGWIYGDLACDQGASQQLGVPTDWSSAAVYFYTRADAEAFAATHDPAAGIARVKTKCAD